ncbi:MAG TPA: helix-turn-helix transcriptional regulator [Candidatus Limnocylindrales bacterium]
MREDAALTRAAVALSAGIDASFLGRIETGSREPSLSTLTAVATVLGADLSVRLYPTTGPRIRDRIQAAMVEAFLGVLDRRWIASPEVPVHRPARGVIDVVLTGRREPLAIASEFNSELRRLEQQIRWHREKEESLPSADLWRLAAVRGQPATSRLLVLRSTRTMRDLALAFEQTLRAAYPAPSGDAVAALTSSRSPWPGPAIVWMAVEGGRGRLLDGAPRGVRLGR